MIFLTLFLMVFSSLHTHLCSDMLKERGAALQLDCYAEEEDECDEDQDVLILEEDIQE